VVGSGYELMMSAELGVFSYLLAILFYLQLVHAFGHACLYSKLRKLKVGELQVPQEALSEKKKESKRFKV
jgi:hypothetical protein